MRACVREDLRAEWGTSAFGLLWGGTGDVEVGLNRNALGMMATGNAYGFKTHTTADE